MEEYLNAVETILANGNYKPNRTGVDTISNFAVHYNIDLQDGFPLLTTKKMSDFRWKSLIYELIWYFSGEEHVKNLQEHTGIWNAWADEEGRLETAYGRYWRRFPIPYKGLDGEAWPDATQRWINVEDNGQKTFDQIQYVLDMLKENPNSRRIIVNAWYPANATISKLPPCHYTYVINVQGDRLNLHLNQRSADIALGVPFNIAAYAIIAHVFANYGGFKPGTFSHTLVDAHAYCGKEERGAFYRNNLTELQERIRAVEDKKEYLDVRDWLEETAPPQESRHDHVPGLLEQLSREPLERPSIQVADKHPDDLRFEDIQLKNYKSHSGIKFDVAV